MIKNTIFIENDEIGIEHQKTTYVQHTDGSDINIGNYQYLTIESIVSGMPDSKDNTDCFLRLKIGSETPDTSICNFWSIDNPEELIEVFNDFARRSGMSCRWEINKYHVKVNEERID